MSVPASVLLSKSDAATLIRAVSRPDDLVMWAVYDDPSDLPGRWVARPYIVPAEGEVFVLHGHLEARTLAELRSMLPGCLTRSDRQPADDLKIVETWM